MFFGNKSEYYLFCNWSGCEVQGSQFHGWMYPEWHDELRQLIVCQFDSYQLIFLALNLDPLNFEPGPVALLFQLPSILRRLSSSRRISFNVSVEEEGLFLTGELAFRCCTAPLMVNFFSCRRLLMVRITSTSFFLYNLWPDDVRLGLIFVNWVSQNLRTYVGSPAMALTSPILKYNLSGIWGLASIWGLDWCSICMLTKVGNEIIYSGRPASNSLISLSAIILCILPTSSSSSVFLLDL